MVKMMLNVEGMACQMCEAHINKRLLEHLMLPEAFIFFLIVYLFSGIW